MTTTPHSTIVAEIIYGLVSATIVFTTLTNNRLPFLKTDRAALVALLIVGIAFCMPGMKIGQYGWLNPFTILGILIGTVALILVGAVLFGARVPFITGERSALIALAGIMVLKVIISIIRGAVHLA